MTIAKNPKKRPPVNRQAEKKTDSKASKFIAGPSTNGERDLVPVLIKFDRAFLARVDAHAKTRGLNRTAFVISTMGDKLAALEGL